MHMLLSDYLHLCTLPKLQCARSAMQMGPPDGHKSHLNTLHVKPNATRTLETMVRTTTLMEPQQINDWTSSYFPDLLLDNHQSEDKALKLHIPSEDHLFRTSSLSQFPWLDQSLGLIKPDSTKGLGSWLNVLPLQTVECALHTMFPETQRYRFSLEDDPENFDRNLFEYFSWSTKNDGTLDRIKTNITRLVVAFQPPWILSDTDIQQFAKSKAFPPYRCGPNMYPETCMDSRYRLWGKMWDVCRKTQSRYFVLTSYNKWVFGAFSLGWTHGFVSEVFSYDSRKPSIAECLIFWLASAMRMTGTPSLPNVPEPISHVFMPPGLSSVKKPDVNGLITTNSESHWDGKSDEVPSSAGVQLTDSDLLDEFTDTGPRAYNNITLRKELLSEWLKKAEDPGSSRNDLSIVPKRMRRMLPEAIDLCYGDWLV